jgi:hypothetical protein
MESRIIKNTLSLARLRQAPRAMRLIAEKVPWRLVDPSRYPKIERVMHYATVAEVHTLFCVLFLDFIGRLLHSDLEDRRAAWRARGALGPAKRSPRNQRALPR